MAPKKKVVAGAPSGEVDVLPKRSTRKRKQVSYAELGEDDLEWREEEPKKKARMLSKRKATVNEDATIIVDQSAPKQAPKKGKQKATANAIEHDENREEVEQKESGYQLDLPESYLKVKQRALTQRLFLLHRERCGTEEVPEEKVQIAGNTGNVYTVHIKHALRCTCPHHLFGRNQCKHIVYVMLLALKAREELACRMAFTSAQLRDLFEHAPPIPSIDIEELATTDEKRKPIEDDCPICCMEFKPEKEAIVYCKAACGNNIHKQCFDKWAQTKRDQYSKVTCPYCRSEWQENEAPSKKNLLQGGVNLQTGVRAHGRFGYINVADQLPSYSEHG
ncbi:hypothetical protein K469DRAFT_712944, partial [Zopfia rhizophila CBS 207.26]